MLLNEIPVSHFLNMLKVSVRTMQSCWVVTVGKVSYSQNLAYRKNSFHGSYEDCENLGCSTVSVVDSWYIINNIIQSFKGLHIYMIHLK